VHSDISHDLDSRVGGMLVSINDPINRESRRGGAPKISRCDSASSVFVKSAVNGTRYFGTGSHLINRNSGAVFLTAGERSQLRSRRGSAATTIPCRIYRLLSLCRARVLASVATLPLDRLMALAWDLEENSKNIKGRSARTEEDERCFSGDVSVVPLVSRVVGSRGLNLELASDRACSGILKFTHRSSRCCQDHARGSSFVISRT